MKQEYNRTVLTITEFDEEDVITYIDSIPSAFDSKPAYRSFSELEEIGSGSPAPPVW